MADYHNPLQPSESDEISLRELIVTIRIYLVEIKLHWVKIALVAFVGGLIFGVNTFLKKRIYPAVLTYMVNEDTSSGGLGGAAAILGQFGFGGSQGENNYDKIVALARTNKILGMALLDPAYKPLLANRIIEVYNLHDEWKGKEYIDNYQFDSNDKNPLAKNLALGGLINLLRGGDGKEGITSFTFDDKTGLLKIIVASRDPELSIDITESIYKSLQTFYVLEATEKSKNNFRLLSERADSIAAELSFVEQKLARNQDGALGLILRTDQVKMNQLQRTAQILTLMFGEVVKNKETANFILKTETPFFQIVDAPLLPIKAGSRGTVVSFMKGFFLLGLFPLFLIIGRKIYTETMGEGD